MNQQQSLALEQALQWLDGYCQPSGVIVSGSIVRGNPNRDSDFDIYVVHEGAFRQRVQRFFNGVPCEFFLNTLAQTYGYFESELKNNRPVTAHLLATGQLVRGHDNPALPALVEAARRYATLAPPVDEAQLLFRTYALATLAEDAADVLAADPATAAYILDKAAAEAIELLFLLHQQPLPRLKERLHQLCLLNPGAGQVLRGYYVAPSASAKLALLTELLTLTTGKTAFFEWSSAPSPA